VIVNVVVIVLLGSALVVQLFAFRALRGREVELDDDGNPYLTMQSRRTGELLTVVGLIIATVGGLVSMWAPGFH
jgi:hypothetical protein